MTTVMLAFRENSTFTEQRMPLQVGLSNIQFQASVLHFLFGLHKIPEATTKDSRKIYSVPRSNNAHYKRPVKQPVTCLVTLRPAHPRKNHRATHRDQLRYH